MSMRLIFFFKQKTAYEMRISDWSSDVCSSDLEIAWASDPVEFFFLQIQGSGRIRTADGHVIRIGYAGQNGREYIGLGRVMRDRGLIGDSQIGRASCRERVCQYV